MRFSPTQSGLTKAAAYPCPLILTSNLRAAADATVVNYDRLSGTDAQGGNSVLMLLRLLRLCNAAEVLLAGADGYRPGTAAYADTGLHTPRGAAPPTTPRWPGPSAPPGCRCASSPPANTKGRNL